jgi:murein DD-endopeptidase MepM/ murein hydrolase activator NlpD
MKLNLNLSRRTRLTAPLVAFTVSAALVAGLSAPSVADDKDKIKDEQKKVKKQIADAKDGVEESAEGLAAAEAVVEKANKRLADAQAKLSQTQGQFAAAQARDAQLQRELEEAQRQLAASEKRLAQSQRDLKAAEEVVEQFAVEQLMSGDRGLQAFSSLVNGEDPMKVTEQLALSSSIGDAQISQSQQVAASRVMLEVERQKAEDLRNQIAARKSEAEANVQIMSTLTAQAAEEKSKVAAHVKRAKAAKDDAKKALAEDKAIQAQLESAFSQLQAQLQKIIEEELARARENNGTTATGDTGGTLTRPVPGIITSPYGWRVHPVLGYRKLHDGTDFRAACGTQVKAAASGTIVSQGYSGAYGNRVVLNNGIKRGVNVMTTYNHLSAFVLPVGSVVKRGQVIAISGTTGLSTGCHLHFMVLENGIRVDPMSWL